MKRRDFLAASAGFAGTLVSLVGRARTRPCPPETFGVAGDQSIASECVDVPGRAPRWFLAQPEQTWRAVAVNDTLRAAHGASPSQARNIISTPNNITTSWTGGCVDQSRGELILPANGGHANYGGNEVYACQIRSETPAWFRLTDQSPVEVVSPPVVIGSKTASTSNTISGQGHNPKAFAAMYRDGRVRAMHTVNIPQCNQGHVWFSYQPSPEGAGFSTPHAWSFNRAYVGIPSSPGSTSLKWSNDPGPWTWLGTSDNGARGETSEPQVKYTSGSAWTSAALDPLTGWIWTAHADAPLTVWTSLDTTGTRSPKFVSSPFRGFQAVFSNTWSVVVYDPAWDGVLGDPNKTCRWRFLVVGASEGKLMALDLTAADLYAAKSWRVISAPGIASSKKVKDWGAVYHRASRSIILGRYPSTYSHAAIAAEELPNFVTIRIATDDRGAYAGDTWKQSVVTDGSTPNPWNGFDGTRNNGAYSKFNIVHDMGDGHAALVCVAHIEGPTYVYKLPLGDFPA
jgi:hypothetical protein